MSAVTENLVKILLNELNHEKQAFVPAPPAEGADPMAGGAPMDPAMAGGAPPMDPAMMDPAMAGVAPPMAPDGLPLPPEPVDDSDIKDQIKQVLEETGVIKPKKVSPEVNTQWLHSKLDALMNFLNIPIPEAPEGAKQDGESGKAPEAKPAPSLSSGSAGQASVADLGSLPPDTVDFGSMGGAAPQGQPKMASSVNQALARLRKSN